MIRRILESGYRRTIGSARNMASGYLSTLTRGGLMQILYVLVVVGLMAGFINAVVFPVSNQALIVYPSGGAQTIPEAILDGFVIIVGGGGVYLAYLSGRQTARARTVNLYLGLALLLIMASLFIGINLAIQKGFG